MVGKVGSGEGGTQTQELAALFRDLDADGAGEREAEVYKHSVAQDERQQADVCRVTHLSQ